MTANDFLTISIDRYGFTINTEPFYTFISWGGLIFAGLLIVGLKTLKKRKRNK